MRSGSRPALPGEPAQDEERACPRQGAAARVQEQLGAMPAVEVGAPAREVPAERCDRAAADRDDALLVALADARARACSRGRYRRLLSATASRHAEAGAVEELDESGGRAANGGWCPQPLRSDARPPRGERGQAAAGDRRGSETAAAGLSDRVPSICRWPEEAARSRASSCDRRVGKPLGSQKGHVALQSRRPSPVRPACRGMPAVRPGRAGRRRPCAPRAAQRAARGSPSTSGSRMGVVIDPRSRRASTWLYIWVVARASARGAPGSFAGRPRPRAGASRTNDEAGAGEERDAGASTCRAAGRGPIRRARSAPRARDRAARHVGSGRPAGPPPRRAGSARCFRALAVAHMDELLLEVDVAEVQRDRFCASQARGVHELEQGPVPQRQ